MIALQGHQSMHVAGVLCLAVGLAACSEEKTLTGEEVLAEAQALTTPEPGLYATTTEMVSFEVPGLPPAQADRLREQMRGLSGEPQPRCLTEAEAEKGFEDMIREIGEGINDQTCAFNEFDATASRISARLSCEGEMGVAAELAFAGTSAADGFDLTMDLEASNAMIPGGSMEMRFKVASERIGECDPAGPVVGETLAAE